jgi:endonuclease G
MKKQISGIVFLIILFTFGCTEETVNPKKDSKSLLNIVGEISAHTEQIEGDFAQGHQHTNERTSSFTETFESASKGSYSGGTISVGSGSWYLTDALIGTLSSDRKYNSRSVRIRNTGYAIMSFNMDNGVSTVKVRHAKFGSDGNSSWRLIYSTDNGSSWYNILSAQQSIQHLPH